MDYYKFPARIKGQIVLTYVCLAISLFGYPAYVIAFWDYVYLKALFRNNIKLSSIWKDATEAGSSLVYCW